MILNDIDIQEYCEYGEMITPFHKELISLIKNTKVISYGQSSFGYDIRMSAKDIRLFKKVTNDIVDPKRFDETFLDDVPIIFEGEEKYFILPAHSYALGVTVECFNLPRDIVAICLGKSTYARAGILVNVTPLEAEWSGYLTLEISNISPSNCKIYLDEGIAQLLFLKGNPCKISYNDRKGKYQNQVDKVVLPR